MFGVKSGVKSGLNRVNTDLNYLIIICDQDINSMTADPRYLCSS